MFCGKFYFFLLALCIFLLFHQTTPRRLKQVSFIFHDQLHSLGKVIIYVLRIQILCLMLLLLDGKNFFIFTFVQNENKDALHNLIIIMLSFQRQQHHYPLSLQVPEGFTATKTKRGIFKKISGLMLRDQLQFRLDYLMIALQASLLLEQPQSSLLK